jgi:8-oxo-dGTP diphosphatase
MTHRIIHIAAALLVGLDGRALLVRKTGTGVFMQPGGKIEPGETAAAALVRELEEELGLVVTTETLTTLGRFEATAANEADARVVADCFELETGDAVAAAREIEEITWISRAEKPVIPLAPLSAEHILPLWRARHSRRA